MLYMFNFFKKNKSNEDPYWKFDESKHFRPMLNEAEFFTSSGPAFFDLITLPIGKHVERKNGNLKNFNTLSYGQKVLYLWRNTLYVAINLDKGIFGMYYRLGNAKYISTMIKGFKHVGCYEMAELMAKSYNEYLKLKDVKVKNPYTNKVEAFNSFYEIKEFNDLDEIESKISLQTQKQFEKYIRSNPSEFCLNHHGHKFDINFEGSLKTYYLNKNIKEIIPAQKGLVMAGWHKKFFENGNLKMESQYVEGESTGLYTEYYENGHKKLSVTNSQETKGKVRIRYFENGSIEEKEYLDDDDTVTILFEYYPNGQIKSEIKIIEEERCVQNHWKENGKKILNNGTGIYIDEYPSFFKEGLERVEIEYVNYKEHGKQSRYFNDVLVYEAEMKEGEQHGITKTYDNEGNLEKADIYENGIKVSIK